MRHGPWFGTTALVIILVSSMLVACGGDDDDADDDVTAVATAAVASPTVATDDTPAGDETPELGTPIAEGTDVSADTSEVVAQAQDFSFVLDVLSVPAGSTVAVDFTNRGSAPHTLTFYIDDAFERLLPGGDSGNTGPGETSAFQFQAPARGTMYYRCEVHPAQMQGELPVE